MSFTNRKTLSAPRWKTVTVVLSIVGLLAVGISCSSGPQPPQPGTPAFFWAAAQGTYRAGDFIKTSEHLQRILASDNEYSARARAWDAVISAGLAKGYIELADNYEAGGRANRANPTPFIKQVSALRSQATAAAVQFTEDIHKVVAADKDPTILLAFGYAAGTAAPPVGLKRVSGGILVQDSEQELLKAAMLQRAVLLSVCAAVGNPDDAAAAQEKLKSGEYRVPRDIFLMAAATALSDQSELFTGKKLDQPNRLKLLSQEAQETLKALPPTKETKALTDKIQARLKKANLT